MNLILPLAWISGGEGIVIFFAILMLFGAKKLPELARGLGSAIREFSKAKDEVEREITRPPTVQEPRIEAPAEIHPYGDPDAHAVVNEPQVNLEKAPPVQPQSATPAHLQPPV